MQGHYETREGKRGGYQATATGRRIYRCEQCNEVKLKKELEQHNIYDLPWHDQPYKAYFCKVAPEDYSAESCFEALMDHGANGDSCYFECCECHRIISEVHPAGLMIQFRRVGGDAYNPGEDQICLRCYEKQILAEGHPRSDFENGSLPGMFFNSGNPELLDAGFKQELDDVLVNGRAKAGEICQQAIALIDVGNMVVIGFERMSEFGGEGYISMFSKPAWMQCPACLRPNHYCGGDKLGNHLTKEHGLSPGETVDMVRNAERVTMEVEKEEVKA
jgi:hypothetical protein